MIYSIVLYGDPILKKKSVEIERGSLDVRQLSDDMLETMKAASGIGLAAPQIGKSIRMFVVDASPLEDEEIGDFRKVFINPEILDENGKKWVFEEGCLSIPGVREDVTRNEKIKIRSSDEDWNTNEEEFNGMLARIILHEFDHLRGILFTDYLSSLKKRLLKGKLANISKGKTDAEYKVRAPLKK